MWCSRELEGRGGRQIGLRAQQEGGGTKLLSIPQDSVPLWVRAELSDQCKLRLDGSISRPRHS